MNSVVYLVVLLILFVSGGVSQNEPAPGEKRDEYKVATASIDTVAVISIRLAGMPGLNAADSKWDVTWELRVLSESEHAEASRSGKISRAFKGNEGLGRYVGKGSFSKSDLSKDENNLMTLKVPLAGGADADTDLASIARPTFLFFASALVYDAKLKKHIVIPLNWVWSYRNYPEAKFSMEFEIAESANNSGFSYSTRMVLPDELKRRVTYTN